MSFADKLTDKASGKQTAPTKKPAKKTSAAPAASQVASVESAPVATPTEEDTRDRGAELERTGRRHVTMYFDKGVWRDILDGARAEDTNGATVVEVLVDRFLKSDAQTRLEVYDEAREITAARRRRK